MKPGPTVALAVGGLTVLLCLSSSPTPAFAHTGASATGIGSPVTMLNLRCEYLQNPMGVNSLNPRLSWALSSNQRGWRQSAYQIQVASSAKLLSAGKPDLWDSGKVASTQSLNIRYGGRPLKSGDKCFWKVRVWDKNGKASPDSNVQTWQMGLLNTSDWTGQWVGTTMPRDIKQAGLTLPTPPFLRKTFDLAKPIRKATFYASARGVYELRLNGKKVGDEVLAPGWTDYNTRIQYQTYDVTQSVRRGANAVGAILGDGWYSGFVGFSNQRNHYGSETAFIGQLVVTFTDGTTQTIGTDTTWQSAAGPIEYSDMLQGEYYDARKAQTGWDTPQYHGTGWKNSVIVPAPTQNILDVTDKLKAAVVNNTLSIKSGNDIGGDPAFNVVKQLKVDYTINGQNRSRTLAENEMLTIPGPNETSGPLVIRNAEYGALNLAKKGPAALVGTHDPAIRVTEQLKPRKITQPKPGNYILDMGQNMVGVVRLSLKAPAGTKVQLRFAEMLNPDGTAYTANLRSARATDTYICSGKGTETWEPRFTFHGFRYVEVTGFPGTPTTDAFTGLVIGSDIPKTGTFISSSPMVNQLQRNIDWGQRGNFLSVPTDCPQRDERLGWMGDAQVFARTATYNRDVSAFFTKWMQDVEDGQSVEGGFSDVSPRKVDNADGAPAWGDAGVIVPWTMFQAYGDRQIVDKHWDAMEKWMSYLTSANPDGLWKKRRNNDFGDWLSINADTPKELLATGYYAYDASLMARMAAATGRTAEAVKYNALFEKIKAAFNAAYVKSDGTITGGTQTCYLVALRFDLLPEAMRPLAASHLVADIRAKNDHLSTGFIGVGYICPTLTDTGYNDVAYKLLLNDTFPSWGYSIKQGATTIWERWDGWTEEKGFQDVGMNSFNHYSLGSVGEWLYGHVAGIATDPDYPGFERIIVKPHPGPGLTFANATYDSIRGRIVSNWKIEGGLTTYDVTIPANATATVIVPNAEASKVKESEAPLSTATAGVTAIRQEGKDTAIELGSGTYRFTATQ
jgi:alpha-L-rhamnosidase